MAVACWDDSLGLEVLMEMVDFADFTTVGVVGLLSWNLVLALQFPSSFGCGAILDSSGIGRFGKGVSGRGALVKDYADEINDAPIEQVRLTVPITDDPTLPALTLRTWVLGLSSCVFLATINKFFSYRQNQMRIPGNCILIIAFPIGKLMAATLPSKLVRIPGTRWTASMNPGPFNIKEHVLISVLAYAGTLPPYSLAIVSQMKVFFHRKINPLAALLVTLTSQLLGYGFAGLFIKILVESPYMWYPALMPFVWLFRTWHEKIVRQKGQLTRLQFFIIVAISSFAYYIVPNYFFPSISALSFVCWIWKDSVTAQQLGSGFHGFGFGAFALDWSTISSFLGSPLVYPVFVAINMIVGFILILYIITPIAYWTNSYNAKRFPLFSSDLFDANGNVYNISRVMNPKKFVFDQHGYDNYSKIYLSIFYVYSFGLTFASITASLTHVALFYGRSIWDQLKEAYSNEKQMNDIHSRIMKKNYDPIPQWWFYAILISMLGLAIFACEGFGKQFQLPFWGVLLACAIALVFTIPIGVLKATMNQSIELNIVSELILGYLYPGKPLAYLTFKSYCMICLSHTLDFISDMKLVYYMKIPPRSFFFAKIIGMVVSSSVNFGMTWWILSSVENICDLTKLPKGSPWTCPSEHVGNSILAIWGVVGPSRMFAPYGQYSIMYIFFLVGLLGPVVVWIMTLVFPTKKWIRLINVPTILLTATYMPPVSALHFWSWFPVVIFFNYVVYRKYKGWWAKYNYILSAALDSGTAFMALFTSFTLQSEGVYGLDWWGLPLDDHCPLAKCPTAPGIQVDGCPVFH
ncbi:oligopeptide transporter 5-like [Magnolia sinica]|uniref:oligopeptide transporter 5-like n=1 Tax=Magnolia sinica TaxID=86752 RepID=UPI002658E78E|nr:oligopeptide transporter 5-like [Magnolia sinica]